MKNALRRYRIVSHDTVITDHSGLIFNISRDLTGERPALSPRADFWFFKCLGRGAVVER
jgi:hypothetical protein